ncbi:hypothetical protein V0M98_34500 (plasmid) [Pseudomonas silesiensis]|uniref:hypothetical protein n=1 Tax=Pseudomonas silesiensis TaxID=1853130 RepID=UPI0030D41D28
MLGKHAPNGQQGITKRELIEALACFPDDAKIVVDGYENGFSAVSVVELVEVSHRPDRSCYDGEYQVADPECGAPLKVISIR